MNLAGEVMVFGPRDHRQLTVHFHSEELRCPCCHVAVIAVPLLWKLEELRRLVGEPVRVTSGYRCPRRNAEVGGSPSSLHMAGYAADLVVEGMEMRKLARLAGRAGFTGILVYDDHVHVDLRAEPLVRLDPSPERG